MSQVGAPPHVPCEDQITQFHKYVLLLMCRARTKLLHVTSRCSSSCAVRGPNYSISQVCAPPHVSCEDQITPFHKYVLLLMCRARTKLLHFTSMCSSSCAVRGPNYSISQVCAPPH